MLKRVISFLMVAIFTLALVTGCSNSNDNPVLVLQIESEKLGIEGTVEIEMYPDKAPNTVKNIISLATKGYYDGINVCKVLPGSLVEIGVLRIFN